MWLVHDLGDRGLAVRAIALVIGSNVDPGALGNLHIRAHALERRFYREVLEGAAERLGIPSLTLLERDAFETAARTLRLSSREFERVLAGLGQTAGRPWRRHEQLAALAAWVALGSRTVLSGRFR